MITLEDVTWRYRAAPSPSLSGLSLEIAPGEVVVVCGASGSGKSTALRLMNGLIPHFHEEGELSGTVMIDGLRTEIAELDEIGLRTGSVLQHPRRQFFADTAAEEIAFAMENFGVQPEQIRSRVAGELAALADAVPIAQPLQRLSGGQQQQVAISAASAHDPRVLLLDEPSSNLSADAVERLAATLARLKRGGATIVVAEHRLKYLQGVADRVVVMRDGRVDFVWSAAEFDAASDEVLEREGLRGAVTTALLPDVGAFGRGVQTSVAQVLASADPEHESLELSDVRCSFGGRTVIDIERASFVAGRVTAIRGANGAGKSTLARIVTGLQRAQGTIRLGGKRLSPNALQRESAIVMQDVQRQLFTDSVEAEIDLAAPGRRGSSLQAGARAGLPSTHPLRQLDLEHLAERHPLSLSGGQQQRLVVAAVRLSGRRIVVFDEPSSGVDRRHLSSISSQIRQVAADGAVVLLISHDEDLLSLAADCQLELVSPGERTAERVTTVESEK